MAKDIYANKMEIIKALRFAIKIVERFKGVDLYFTSVMNKNIQIQGNRTSKNEEAIEAEGITLKKGKTSSTGKYTDKGYTIRIILI
tara:strand:- start:235 stop:492 length:258 start_codon:yes stop_codon:yes gene_type:complete